MQFVVKPEYVAVCVNELREQKIHPTFAGYLCVLRAAVKFQRDTNLPVDFKEFFETFLRVDDAPAAKPYALPFSESTPSESNKWFNKNVAGSYAPSSLRSISPFLQPVEIGGERRSGLYSLKKGHINLAAEHLLYGNPVPVMYLAAFLYRDFAFIADEPDPNVVVTTFMEEFGFESNVSSSMVAFNTLFSMVEDVFDGQWFKEI